MKRQIGTLTALVALAIVAPRADGATAVLTHLNSQFVISSNQTTAHTWEVDGTDQLFQQAFWFRVGDTGPEVQLASIFGANSYKTTLSGNSSEFHYKDHSLFDVKIRYTLTGGAFGSLNSDVDEEITITNKSGSALDLSFFQYSDFDLAGTFDNDAMQFVNANTVQQWETVGPTTLSETVVTPPADRYEGAAFSTTLDKLNDGGTTNLSNSPGIGNVLSGDMTWAYQWDRLISGGDSIDIDKHKRMSSVPEPGSIFLLGFGLLASGIAVRRRKTK